MGPLSASRVPNTFPLNRARYATIDQQTHIVAEAQPNLTQSKAMALEGVQARP